MQLKEGKFMGLLECDRIQISSFQAPLPVSRKQQGKLDNKGSIVKNLNIE